MNPQEQADFTLTETIVVLFVAIALLCVFLSAYGSSLAKSQMTQPLSNMKQLHLATEQMALDSNKATGDTNIGWPGDLNGSFARWAVALVPSYLTTNDFCKLLSAPDRVTPPGYIPMCNTNGTLVYAVSKTSEGSAVFLSSANFTNTPSGGLPLDAAALPYGTKGFIIFHKAGDGSILNSKQIGHTNIVGTYVPLCR